MKILLDTHAYLWFLTGSNKLSADARRSIEDPANQKMISVASFWEITIKHSLGKLVLQHGLKKVLTDHISDNGFEVLPIEPGHLLSLNDLAMHHRDPFDRLIIATAQSENIPVVSVDAVFNQYDVTVIW